MQVLGVSTRQNELDHAHEEYIQELCSIMKEESIVCRRCARLLTSLTVNVRYVSTLCYHLKVPYISDQTGIIFLEQASSEHKTVPSAEKSTPCYISILPWRQISQQNISRYCLLRVCGRWGPEEVAAAYAPSVRAQSQYHFPHGRPI